MDTSLLDDVALLLRDDRGRPVTLSLPTGALLAGAAMAQLALDGAVRLTEAHEPGVRAGRLVRTGEPPSDPRLTPLLDRMDGRRPKDAVSRLTSWGIGRGAGERLDTSVLDRLAAEGVFEVRRTTWLGVVPRTEWVPGPRWDVRTAVVERVRAALAGTGPVDARTAAAVSLLLAVNALPKVAPPGLDRRALKARAKEISDSQWAATAVKKAVEEMYAAVMVATTVTTVAATS